MTRNQWIILIVIVLLVFIAVAIGVVLWMRSRPTVVVTETNALPGNQSGVIVTGGAKKQVKQVNRPTSTGATFREVLGKVME